MESEIAFSSRITITDRAPVKINQETCTLHHIKRYILKYISSWSLVVHSLYLAWSIVGIFNYSWTLETRSLRAIIRNWDHSIIGSVWVETHVNKIKNILRNVNSLLHFVKRIKTTWALDKITRANTCHPHMLEIFLESACKFCNSYNTVFCWRLYHRQVGKILLLVLLK